MSAAHPTSKADWFERARIARENATQPGESLPAMYLDGWAEAIRQLEGMDLKPDEHSSVKVHRLGYLTFSANDRR